MCRIVTTLCEINPPTSVPWPSLFSPGCAHLADGQTIPYRLWSSPCLLEHCVPAAEPSPSPMHFFSLTCFIPAFCSARRQSITKVGVRGGQHHREGRGASPWGGTPPCSTPRFRGRCLSSHWRGVGASGTRGCCSSFNTWHGYCKAVGGPCEEWSTLALPQRRNDLGRKNPPIMPPQLETITQSSSTVQTRDLNTSSSGPHLHSRPSLQTFMLLHRSYHPV